MIISVSRRTDIPAFYSDWFINRLKEGFVYVRNPMNIHNVSKINLSLNCVDFIVFWTKNPERIIDKLNAIDNMGYKYYFLFTLNPYDKNIETNVLEKKVIIENFHILSDKIGSDKVVWRYDPIFYTDKIDIEYHKKYFNYLAEKLKGYTKKCIISFLDLYKKCERNMKNIDFRLLNNSDMKQLTKVLVDGAKKYDIDIVACAEKIDLSSLGVKHGKCIDDSLISHIINEEIEIKKDKNQRKECKCVESIDIGSYNTCMHNCVYCYANYNKNIVKKNFSEHDKKSPLLFGNIDNNDKIYERKIDSYIKDQKSFEF